ncbi:MAG: COX15/CtaA family protein, partial [Rhizobiaceae bacterium]
PPWTNFTDNATMVQFVHRLTAYGLWIVAFLHAIFVWRREPRTTHGRRAWMLFLLVSLQAVIGIMTLLLQVPIHWALGHQLGGVIVLAFATAHWRALGQVEQTTLHPNHGSN